MEAMSEFMKQGNDFIMSEQGRANSFPMRNRSGKITVEVCNGRLNRVFPIIHAPNIPAADRIIHPASTPLAWSCVEIEIESADELSLTVGYIEQLGIRMPELNRSCFHWGDVDAVKILYQTKHTRQHARLRKILLYFL